MYINKMNVNIWGISMHNYHINIVPDMFDIFFQEKTVIFIIEIQGKLCGVCDSTIPWG